MNVKLAHVTTGRIRFRVPEMSKTGSCPGDLRSRLEGLREVRELEMSRRSASLIIYCNAGAEEAIIQSVREWASEFEEPETASNMPGGNGSARKVAVHALLGVQELNERVKRATGGLDLRKVIPLALFFLALLALLRSALRQRLAMPGWYDLFWFSFCAYFILQDAFKPQESPELPAVERGTTELR